MVRCWPCTFDWPRSKLLGARCSSPTTLVRLGPARALVSGELPLFGLAQTSALGAVAGAVAYGVGLLAHAL